MIRFGVWHGGSSYSTGHDWRDDLEQWDNLSDIHNSLIARKCGRDLFRYMREDDGFFSPDPERSGRFDTPAVDETQYIDLFALETGEPYLRLWLGPREGLRMEAF